MNRILTLYLYDNPQGDTEPNVAAVISINENHIISAVYSLQSHDYLITLSGHELEGTIRDQWVPETRVKKNSTDIERVENKYVKEAAGRFSSLPISVSVRDEAQIRKVWHFMNGDTEECPLFKLREDLERKILEAKEQASNLQEQIKEEMQKSHLVDTAGNPLDSASAGKLVGIDGEIL